MTITTKKLLSNVLLQEEQLKQLKYKIPWKEVGIFISIIALASFVRFWALGDIGFNSDESVYSGQAANLAGYEEFSKYFSAFRAHPLLFQFLVSLLYGFTGVIDFVARSVSAIFGIMTVIITYYIGKTLYNKNVGILSSLILALLPYHIVVTRQAMVDVPFSFFFTLTLLFMAKYIVMNKNRSNNINQSNGTITRVNRYIKNNYKKNDRIWIVAIGISCGLTFLSKEVGIVLLISTLLYMQIVRKLGLKNLIILLLIFSMVISPHIIIFFTNKEATKNAFLYSQWQLSRPSNHPSEFYIITLQGSLGYILSTLVILSIGYVIITKERLSSALLLIWWIAIPLIFFQLWPTKGFYYLLPLIPPFVVLGVSFLFSNGIKKLCYNFKISHNYRIISLIIIVLSIFVTTSYVKDHYMFPKQDEPWLAGSGGIPYAREAALWIKENTPEGSVFMTIGPTLGNVIKFYANSDTLALSINPNPAKHNPSYSPIINPDLMIRNGQIQYLIYDVYSATRTQHFADKLNYYVDKYDAQLIHSEYKKYYNPETKKVILKPVILVYVINGIDLSKR